MNKWVIVNSKWEWLWMNMIMSEWLWMNMTEWVKVSEWVSTCVLGCTHEWMSYLIYKLECQFFFSHFFVTHLSYSDSYTAFRSQCYSFPLQLNHMQGNEYLQYLTIFWYDSNACFHGLPCTCRVWKIWEQHRLQLGYWETTRL